MSSYIIFSFGAVDDSGALVLLSTGMLSSFTFTLRQNFSSGIERQVETMLRLHLHRIVLAAFEKRKRSEHSHISNKLWKIMKYVFFVCVCASVV